MNNLNSILIEGTLMADPQLSNRKADDVPECRFEVESTRYMKGEADPNLQKVTISVLILTEGRLAKVCAEYLKAGRGVRVVGRLDQNEVSDTTGTHKQFFVRSDLVEFEPQIKKSEDFTPNTTDRAVPESEEQ